MQPFLELLKRCAENYIFDSGDPDCKTVLDQLCPTIRHGNIIQKAYRSGLIYLGLSILLKKI